MRELEDCSQLVFKWLFLWIWFTMDSSCCLLLRLYPVFIMLRILLRIVRMNSNGDKLSPWKIPLFSETSGTLIVLSLLLRFNVVFHFNLFDSFSSLLTFSVFISSKFVILFLLYYSFICDILLFSFLVLVLLLYSSILYMFEAFLYL